MGVFANILNWLREKIRPQGDSPPYLEAENPETWETCSEDSSSEVMLAAYYDKDLFERARTQWQFGDWESLARIERESLNHHPQRASLALLAAAGHQQRGNTEATREFTHLAKEWGASKKMISQVLIAGVYNTLGKASALCGQQQRAIGHFKESLRTAEDGGDVRLLTQARLQREMVETKGNNLAKLLGNDEVKRKDLSNFSYTEQSNRSDLTTNNNKGKKFKNQCIYSEESQNSQNESVYRTQYLELLLENNRLQKQILKLEKKSIETGKDS